MTFKKQYIKKWIRTLRNYKIVILGVRSGTSLVHKCLLITGLLNWGTWSLEHFECEPPIKQKIWATYPNINKRLLKPKYFWEIAKSPVLGFVLKQLVDIYGDIRFIVMERPIKERVDSHIKTWGDGMLVNIFNKMPTFQKWIESEFGFIPEDIETFETVFHALREAKREEFLKNYPQEKILRVGFHNLMIDFEGEMKRIAEFIDVDYNTYIKLWREMRKIKHMDTSSDINKWLENTDKKI